MDLAAKIDPEGVDKELNVRGYMIVRDQEFTQICECARADYRACFAQSKPHVSTARFDYRALKIEPWRKMAIGSKNGLGHTIAQNLQSIYFDAHDRNYPSLVSLFGAMIAVRNKLMRVDPDFGNDPERDGFWNACRVHHYPRGGGFMSIHRDTYFPTRLEEKDKPFYQMLVLLSRKNIDFFSGGGVLINSQDQKIDLEVEAGFGSMILYDGRTPHGVEDVDPDQMIDFSRADGRLVALVNLYNTMKHD
jgi:hypothetical protein